MGVFRDEQGNRSAARVFLAAGLAFTGYTVLVDVHTRADVSPDIYVLITALVVPLIVWAAGPRIAQYLGPQVAGIVGKVSEAAKARLDNRKTDDER